MLAELRGRRRRPPISRDMESSSISVDTGAPLPPEGARKGSQRPQTPPDWPRRLQGVLAGERLPSPLSPTGPDGPFVAGGQGVAGSNPAVPTGQRGFVPLLTIFGSQWVSRIRLGRLRGGCLKDSVHGRRAFGERGPDLVTVECQPERCRQPDIAAGMFNRSTSTCPALSPATMTAALKATVNTRASAIQRACSRPSARSHTRTIRSSPPLTAVRPSALTATAETAPS